MSAPARPTFVKRNENLAELPSSRRSAASASTAPAPAATPLTAATIGIGQSRIAFTTEPLIRVNSSSSPADIPQVWELGEEVAEVGVHVEGEGVELVRPGERHGRDAVLDREVEVLPLFGERRGGAERAHDWMPPPSSTSVWPLIAPASGAARNSTANATSSGVSRRPRGVIFTIEASASSAERPVFSTMLSTVRRVMSVSTHAGHTALAVTPVPAVSAAAARKIGRASCR